jgi:TrmH family RNA methyltransferase
MPREITAFSNPLVKQVRSLRDKKHRRAEGLFIAEGLRIVTEAREAGWLPRTLFFARATAHPLLSALIDEVEAAGGEAVATSPDILHKLSGKDNPQTVLGVFEQFDTSLERLDRSSAPIWIVAQALRDPGNLGTILRTGDAVGAGGLILIDDCVDPFSVEAVRASMGALFTQRIAAARWDAFVAWLRAGEGMLVGTSLAATLDYQQPRYARPAFILVGNEAQGLPADYESECDLLVKIPMMGKADSLNAAVATAVMAYEVQPVAEKPVPLIARTTRRGSSHRQEPQTPRAVSLACKELRHA